MARAARQLSFFPAAPRFFGGALMKGRRKTRRPLAFKRPLHLVMKSSRARRRWAFLDSTNKRQIERWLRSFAKRSGIRVYRVAVNWDHLHLVIRVPNRSAYNRFIRSFSGTLPKAVLGFEHPTESFWDHRPFTRIVSWGRDYRGTCEYVLRNTLEALGLVTYKKRVTTIYARWLARTGAFG
jgi:REP element-mobilizing transposase RayT